MTLLYGRDASGNQVPLLVDGSGIVQTSGGGGASWPGTSSQLTAGDGTAVNVGSGLSLAAGTLTAGGYSTVWDVDWKTVTPTTFTTSPSTIVVNGVDVTAQKTNAAATLEISANGFDLSGQSSGNAYIEIDLSDLSIFFNRGGYRIWSMWDSSLASWTNGSSISRYYTGVRESLFGYQLASTTRLSGNTRDLRTQNPLSTNDSTTNATSANFDTEIFELSPDGIMSVYLGASVGGAWPTFANMRRTLLYYTPGSWFRIVPDVSTANGIAFIQMEVQTSVAYRLLRSKIDRMA